MAQSHDATEASAADLRAIRSAAFNYVDGYLTGDSERHASSYHPEALKRRFVVDEAWGITTLDVLTPQVMVDAAESGNSIDPSAEFEVIVDSVDGDIASVRIYSTRWVDLLHIVKARGEWRILHAAWTERDDRLRV